MRRVSGKWSQRAAGLLSRNDLAQACRIRICRRFAAYDPSRGPPEAWIFTICESCCHDEYDRESRRPVALLGDYGPVETSINRTGRDDRQPDAGLRAADAVEAVRKLLGLVNPDARAVVERFFGLDGEPAGETIAGTAASLGLQDRRCKELFECAMVIIASHAEETGLADAL